MTSSKKQYDHAYVWIWLPGELEPVVAGKLTAVGSLYQFNYGKSYLKRENAIAIYEQELPLKSGLQLPQNNMKLPGCIRDASPDAWGRRVVINRLLGQSNTEQLDELTYLLESGSDRIGALDFQVSSSIYEPRLSSKANLTELANSAHKVEQGIPLNSDIDLALFRGTSIGGARPKALIQDDHSSYIAKFSSSTDLYNIVKTEFIAMRLAKLCGIDVANVKLTRAAGKDVLLIERFDREGQSRKIILSALTLFGLDEMMARYASYETLAEIIRHKFSSPKKTLQELFSRLVFCILIGNTDDHARNHAAFWDGKTLSLTPAYDLCPQGRTGHEATQAMLITNNNRMSKLSTCIAAAHHFLLSEELACSLIAKQLETIGNHWQEICELADISLIDKRLLWGRQFLNPFSYEDLSNQHSELYKLATRVVSATSA